MQIPHVSVCTETTIRNNHRCQGYSSPQLENQVQRYPDYDGIWVGTEGRPTRGARGKGPTCPDHRAAASAEQLRRGAKP